MPKTYGAKQVASRIGTDAKTLRKFFRSSSSPYEGVGQGRRYEFDEKELPKIKKAFDAWRAKNQARMSGTKPEPPKPEPTKTKVRVNKEIELSLSGFEGEPTPKELEEIEAEMTEHFPDEDIELEN